MTILGYVRPFAADPAVVVPVIRVHPRPFAAEMSLFQASVGGPARGLNAEARTVPGFV